MSRNYPRNVRGRPPTVGSNPKFTKPKENSSDTYQRQLNSKKAKPIQRNAVTNRMKNKRKRADSTTEEDLSSLDGSDTADDASDEDSEEDADDEDDLPAVPAPSRSHRLNETGRQSHSLPMDNVSIAGSMDSMFGDYDNYFDEDDDPRLSPEENRKRFENKVFADSDDDNDDVYQAVDDISDSEGDYDNDDDRLDEQELLAILSEEDNSEADDILNQIDGLSAYGFGDDSDASIHRLASSQGSDSGNETVTERRVHFAVEADRSVFMGMSESPTITRALLPSALPDSGFSPHVDKRMLAEELEDSDLTDDCLPEQAHHSPSNKVESDKEMSPSVSPPSKKHSKKAPRRRGPPRGIFIDDGEKPSGILDSSGKVILMTNPHLLGEEFARRYGASPSSSPEVGFAELIEESDSGEQATDLVPGPAADIMLASLNSAMNDPSNLGLPIGPLEAFYPPNTILLGDYVLDPDDLEENFRPDDDLGEDVINLDDVIKFDEDTDDESMPTSPIYMPPSHALPSFANMNNGLAHLNNSNVTAFRRNADPAYAAFSNTPSFHDMELFSSPFSTPAPRRKRKHLSSPYTSSHYKGVTPVQRVRDPNQPQTPEAVTPAKRRRLMT